MNVITVLISALPAIIVAITAYYLLKKLLDSYQRNYMISLKAEQQKATTPIRLQAYERIILLLERISPSSLIFRVKDPDYTVSQFHTKLLENIRDEFEHNLSQQIYVSAEGWKYVVNAKEEIIKLINSAAMEMEDDASANQLARKIFEKSAELGLKPVERAKLYLKREVKEYF
ncbi:MAG: hypothetical protein K9I68_08100 [Bacteroidales bacterium]|nr:hypothetical protein [Bacteroidales bacterium]MCF8339164.1 hypothetical protein [Bacteroidales bacterium]